MSEKDVREIIDNSEEVEESAEETAKYLASLPILDYEKQRKPIAKRLSIRVGALDELVIKARSSIERSNTSPNSSTKPSKANGSNDGSKTEDPVDLEAVRTLRKGAAATIEHPDPMALVRAAIREAGYAGDTGPAELAYVALSSRFQDRPLNLHYEAQSGSGKSFTVDTVLPLFPPDAYHKLDAGSPHALVYSSESFEQRFIILSECDSIPADGCAASAIRSITTDCEMSYETVEKNRTTNKLETRRIVRKGPTGLITTGIRPLEEQMATRVLRVPLRDDEQQTRQILQAEARAANQRAECTPSAKTEQLIAFQKWLALAGEKRVVVPFADALADLVPATIVRMRRDFPKLLAVIRTLAFLTQYNRQRTSDGEIVAILADYEDARKLLAPLFDSIAAEGITEAVRQTVGSNPGSVRGDLADRSRRPVESSKIHRQSSCQKRHQGRLDQKPGDSQGPPSAAGARRSATRDSPRSADRRRRAPSARFSNTGRTP
jgi:hypothetical protein